MKVCLCLIVLVFILTTAQEGNSCFVGGPHNYVRTGTEGQDVTITCFFDDPNTRKRFCRDDCRDEDILVETTGARAQRGRYTMEHQPIMDALPSVINLKVTIKNLTTADSGRYSCVFGDGHRPHETQRIDLRVQDAPKSEPRLPPQNVPSSPPASTLKTHLITRAQSRTTSEPSKSLLSTSAPPASTPKATLETLPTRAAAQEPHVGLEFDNTIKDDGVREEVGEKTLDV